MTTILTGRDKVSILFIDITNDLADGDAVEISPVSDVGKEIVGKNDNSIIYSTNEGRRVEVTIRLLRGSKGDTLLSLYYSYFTQLNIFTPLFGVLEQRIGDGEGNVKSIRHDLTGLFYTKEPVACKVMASNGEEQAVIEYNLRGKS